VHMAMGWNELTKKKNKKFTPDLIQPEFA
jgi:hypothetical protein